MSVLVQRVRRRALAIALTSAVITTLVLAAGGAADAAPSSTFADCKSGPIKPGRLIKGTQVDETGSGYVEQVGGECFDWWYTTDLKRKKSRGFAYEKKVNVQLCGRLSFQVALNKVLGHGQLKTSDFGSFPIQNSSKHPVAHCSFSSRWIALEGTLLRVKSIRTVDVEVARDSSNPDLLGETISYINSDLNYTFTEVSGIGAGALIYTSNRSSSFSGIVAKDKKGTVVNVTVDTASLRRSLPTLARQALVAGQHFR